VLVLRGARRVGESVPQLRVLGDEALEAEELVLERVGLFDEAFWVYVEDADLCVRARAAGFAPLYVRFVDLFDAVAILGRIMDERAWDRAEFKQRAAVT